MPRAGPSRPQPLALTMDLHRGTPIGEPHRAAQPRGAPHSGSQVGGPRRLIDKRIGGGVTPGRIDVELVGPVLLVTSRNRRRPACRCRLSRSRTVWPEQCLSSRFGRDARV